MKNNLQKKAFKVVSYAMNITAKDTRGVPSHFLLRLTCCYKQQHKYQHGVKSFPIVLYHPADIVT